MAQQLCPSCQQKSFTWCIDDETGQQVTNWHCHACGYGAQEDEHQARPCPHCAAGEESQLTDAHRQYWWCYRCHRTTTIQHLPAT